MECSTYTYLQGGKHRSLEQPEGFSPEARRANSEAAHLLEMFRSAKRANSKTLFFVENPVGYMQHSQFARRMETELGLTRLRVTFCSFTVGRERVRKPTHLWTNSRVLIGMFKNDMFYCTPEKPCGCANHISVRPARGAGYRARDAAWWPSSSRPSSRASSPTSRARSPPRAIDAVADAKPKLEPYST